MAIVYDITVPTEGTPRFQKAVFIRQEQSHCIKQNGYDVKVFLFCIMVSFYLIRNSQTVFSYEKGETDTFSDMLPHLLSHVES